MRTVGGSMFCSLTRKVIILVLMLVSYGTYSYSASKAIDWVALGFPSQGPSSANYDETHNDIRVSIEIKNNEDLGVAPGMIHSITGGGTPPISNSAPFPSIDFDSTANSNNSPISVQLNGATASDSVIAPGQYFFIGGLDTSSATNLILDRVRFSELGGGFINNSLISASTTYAVDTTDTAALAWVPGTASLGSITFTPDSGTSGAIFLRNDSGVFLDSVTFRVRNSVITSMYFGATIPEPSTYLQLLGVFAVLAVLLRKRCIAK